MSSTGRIDKRKGIAVIGAGAAGMSCAATLAQHPEKFHITVFDTASYTGGQATSIPLDDSKYVASWMNDGVQGGSHIFRHTFDFFRRYGHEPQEVKLQVSFGKGRDSFWTNVFPSPVVDNFSNEIKKLGKVFKWIKYLIPVVGVMPVKTLLRLFWFSDDFNHKMVIPLLALFLGTGNQTPNIPSALLERLFEDPNMKLWDYDPDTLLPNLPTMFTFPNLSDFYRDWAGDLRSKGVDFRLLSAVEILQRNKNGIMLRTRNLDKDDTAVGASLQQNTPETFDEMVLCVGADEAKKLLGRFATWEERFVLGGVKFYDDITVTHSNSAYFQGIFETEFKEDLCAEPKTKGRNNQISFATNKPRCQKDGWVGFQPMYYTHSYRTDPDKIEMGFDCSNYQHQFRQSVGKDEVAPASNDHVYQTIFLNKQEKNLWTIDNISEDKIIGQKWWHQFGHRWQHYVRVVPGMMFINGKNRTYFAGSWTLVNMHEIACISGIAAAYRLGATYRRFDGFAEDLFAKYLLLSHGVRYKHAKESKSR